MHHADRPLRHSTTVGRPAAGETTLRSCLALGRCLAVALLATKAPAALAQNVHNLPLFMPADAVQQGFVRIINDSEDAGTVRIHAIDDEGERFGPVELSLEGLQSSHFNSGDLENGNPDKGLSGAVGDGSGNWRLELDTDLDIQALAYIRTPQGFLTGVHDVVEGASMRWRVHFFNPASNLGKKSLLRVINASGIETEVEIEGRDDVGASGESKVQFTLPADGARILSAQDLEGGYSATESESEFDGSFGDGTRKWQLFVSAGRPIHVMSLMLSSDGLLSNLSTVTREDIIRGSAGADELRGGNGDDVIDPGDNGADSDELDIVHGSAGDDRIAYTGSGANGYQQLEYSELSEGVTVTIDGAANLATVDKGSAGTDTIVDIANPLNAGGEPPYSEQFERFVTLPYNGGFELFGTPYNDHFDVALGDRQWMGIGGDAGADTFNIESGSVRIDYGTATAGIDIDLGAGRADDDGFGDTDIINGNVQGVAGSQFSDDIRGSDNDEVFIGRAGNDNIDGGGGADSLQFGGPDSRLAGLLDIRSLAVDLGAGTATGTWNGTAFSYTISNIENVRGGSGDDTLRGSDLGNILNGGDGNDTLDPGDADGNDDEYDEIEGSAGNDRIVFTGQAHPIWTGLHYWNLGSGITATIDGVANSATIDKGPAGTDTIEDVANPMNSWALNVTGTDFDDVFNVTVGTGQRLQLRGEAGADTFNIQSTGQVRIQYHHSPAGVDIDLEAGRVNDDGYGDVDTINGTVVDVRCSEFTDKIRGSDNDETFQCMGGNDTIDGGGGYDRLLFHRWGGARGLIVFMEENTEGETTGIGTARGTWNGKAFSYTFSNIEHVSGGPDWDILVGSPGDDTLEGRGGYDIFAPRGGNDTIVDLRADDGDVLYLDSNLVEDFALTHADVIDAARQDGDDVLIDLSAYGEGTIRLKDFQIDWLSSEQIRL